MESKKWTFYKGSGPVFATALHAGHEVRNELLSMMALEESNRRREEDPLTDLLATVGDQFFQSHVSRFEVDLNRERSKAVYVRPDDAWGLRVWKRAPSQSEIEESLKTHDEFYRTMTDFLEEQIRQYGKILLLDIHSYNHKRDRRNIAPPSENPDLDLGVTTVNFEKFGDVVDAFESELAKHKCGGKDLLIGRNVRYPDGGFWPEWVYENYGDHICTITLEYKKIFMDEWSSKADLAQIEDLRHGLKVAVESIRGMLQ